MNYAASVILEVRQPASSSEPFVRFNFKNGTDDDSFRTYSMRFPGWDGSADTDVPLSTFVSAFQPAGINTTLEWCNACGQTQARGCAALFAGNGTSSTGHAFSVSHDTISPVGAGFLGAGLTILVYAVGLGLLSYFGLLSLGRKARPASRPRFGKNDHMELHSSVSRICVLSG